MNTARIVIADRELTLTGLSYKTVRLLIESGAVKALAGMSGMPTGEQMRLVRDIVTESIRRAHPEITADWVESNSSFAALPALVPLILEISGFVVADPNAPSPALPSTSDGSLGASAPPFT